MPVRDWRFEEDLHFLYNFWMSPEEKELLERVARQLDENQLLLKTLKTAYRWNLILRVAYWVLIILTALGAFVFIQPYISFLKGVSGDVKDGVNQASDIRDLMKDL